MRWIGGVTRAEERTDQLHAGAALFRAQATRQFDTVGVVGRERRGTLLLLQRRHRLRRSLSRHPWALRRHGSQLDQAAPTGRRRAGWTFTWIQSPRSERIRISAGALCCLCTGPRSICHTTRDEPILRALHAAADQRGLLHRVSVKSSRSDSRSTTSSGMSETPERRLDSVRSHSGLLDRLWPIAGGKKHLAGFRQPIAVLSIVRAQRTGDETQPAMSPIPPRRQQSACRASARYRSGSTGERAAGRHEIAGSGAGAR